MRLGIGQMRELTDDLLAFGKALGATDVVINTPPLPGDGFYEYQALVNLRLRCESAGLHLEAVENLPRDYYLKVMLGLPGRDQQIENWCKTLRNTGKAGIPILGYNFMALSVWRTSRLTLGRGNARVTSYNHDLVKGLPSTEWGEISDEQMWSNYSYFLKAVLPVAEQAGVVMAVHPDDPPISPIAGIARVLRSHDALKRAMDIVPSKNHKVEFCQGTISEMPGDVVEFIREMGKRDKIAYVHFRNVTGQVPKFAETWIDEGYVDMLQAMRAYKDVGFSGVMIDDHAPMLPNDTDWGHRARAFQTGYIAGIIKAVKAGA
ncbi:MAG: mannonate dehydratase [Chloroflexota bacterium]|nr:mannonate dehydratase [Chloroflexota bacterium]